MRGTGKYRGQRVDNGAWVYGDLIHFPATTAIGHPDKGGVYWEEYDVIPETVGELTGLTDKRKGQGLYDGDRVIIGGDVGVLVWDELDLCLALEVEDGSYQSLCRFYSCEEIDAVEYIGNEEKPCQCTQPN